MNEVCPHEAMRRSEQSGQLVIQVVFGDAVERSTEFNHFCHARRLVSWMFTSEGTSTECRKIDPLVGVVFRPRNSYAVGRKSGGCQTRIAGLSTDD